MRAKLQTVLSFALGLVLLTGFAQAQIITTASTVMATPGSTVSVPLVVQNFTGVASASLALEYDPSVMTYLGYTSNPALAGGMSMVNPSGNLIIAAFFATSAVTMADGSAIFTYNFTYNGGTSILNWDLATPGNCQYSDINGNTLPATFINGTVSQASSIIVTTQPANTSVTAGGNATFSVAATNSDTYKWQESVDGTSWNDLIDAGSYSGTSTTELTIANVSTDINGYSYRCVCSNSINGDLTNSNPAILTVTPVIAGIVINAPTLTSCPGSILNVPISGTDIDNFEFFSMKLAYDPTIMTYVNYSNVNPGLSGGTLTVTPASGEIQVQFNSANLVNLGSGNILTLEFNYIGGSSNLNWSTIAGECEFTNLITGILPATFVDGSVNPSALTPSISANPGNQSVVENMTSTFSITSLNATNFQWQVSTNTGGTWSNINNVGNYSGVTTSTLTISNTPLSYNGYWYRCIANETVCNQSVNSNYGLLSVSPGGSNIITTLGNHGACPGDQVLVPVNVVNFVDVYSFQLVIKYDTNVLTYDTIQNVNNAINAGGFIISNADAGNVYIAWFTVGAPVSIGSATICDIIFQYNSGNVALKFDTLNSSYGDAIGDPYPATFIDGFVGLAGNAPVVTQQPVNVATNINGNASFVITAQNTNAYQWQESIDNGVIWIDLVTSAVYTGVNTNTLNINNATALMDGYNYRCQITGGQCNVDAYSESATLSIAPAGTIVITAGYVNTCPGGTVVVPIKLSPFTEVESISLKLNYDTTALTYVNYQNPLAGLSSGTFVVDEAFGQVNFGWFSIAPLTITTESTLIEYVFNYDNNFSNLEWDVTPGSCVISDITMNPVPQILVNGAVVSQGPLLTSNPSDVSAFPGDNKQFSVSAVLTNSYLWQINTGSGWSDLSNNATYNGVDTYILEISNITIGMDTYQYRCKLNGICGDAFSEAATLSVIPLIPVVVTAPAFDGCPGAVVIPVSVSDFNNIGNFTLVLNYPTNIFTSFTGYQNVNPALVGTLSVTSASGVITINYTGTGNLNLGSGNLLDLKFNSNNSGTGNLTWNNTTSSFTTPGGASMLMTLNNGTAIVAALPGAPAAITGPTTICLGTVSTQYTTAGSTNATSYLWTITPSNAGTITNNGTTITITWDAVFTGSVYLVVKGVNSCGNGPQITKNITIYSPPLVSLAAFNSVCTSTPAFALTGGVPLGGTYSGTAGVSGGQFNPQVAGPGNQVITYTVSNPGCTASANQPILVNQSPSVTLNLASHAYCYYNPPVLLTGGLPAGGVYSGSGVNSTTGVFTPAQNLIGFVTVKYTYSIGGCSDSATEQIQVSWCTGIDENNPAAISVNPNPSNGQFELSLDNLNEDVNITIYNNVGQLVYQEKLTAATYNNILDLSTQPKGIYYLRITGNNTLLEEKIIIQ